MFDVLPIIATSTTKVSGSPIFNSEEFDIIFVSDKKIKIANARDTIEIKHSEFKKFDLAYCITVHKSQGSTYNFEYTIYDYNFSHFDPKLLYTAMSRSTQKSNINFVESHYKVNQGHIYKITNLDNKKIYIGSTTKEGVYERLKEHKKSYDNSPLHKDMQTFKNWEIERIKTIEYIDLEELLIAETCSIMHYDSINTGYNTKYSVDLDNIH